MGRGREAGLRRGALFGLLLAAAVSSAGCAAFLSGLRTAPSGLSESEQELRNLLAGGRSDRALSLLDGHHVGDELLQLQFRGLTAHYAGRWEESSRALERAFEVAEDRYTKSVTRALLSLVTSDRVLDYDPPRPERLFLHYYGALNYLRRGEPDEAAVEARRLAFVLQRALEEEDASVTPALGRALSVFAGSIFEAAGLENDAAVSYRRARVFGERAGRGAPGGPAADSGAASRRDDGVDPWARRAGGASAGDGARAGPGPGATGRVLVVLERGFVAHKVGRDVTLFLTPGEVRRLHRYRRAARAESASADTAELLALAERVADRSLDGRSHRRFGRSPRFQDVDPVILRIAWPELREPSARPGTATLRLAATGGGAGSDSAGAVDASPTPAARIGAVGPRYRADLSEAVREAFRGSRALKMAKSLLRAMAKLAVAEGIEGAVSEEDETLGEILGTAAQVAGALLERADTRSWHLLPDRLDLYLLHLPPGSHRLEARVGDGGGGEERIPVGPVQVEAGGLHVVTVRDWR